MKIPEKNKLWALATSPEALRLTERYPHSMADEDHCLIIAPERPEGAVEMDDELLRLMPATDWAWLMDESRKIYREQAEEYHGELMAAMDGFFERFEKALLKARAEGTDSEQKTENGTGGAA